MDFDRWDDLMHGPLKVDEAESPRPVDDGLSAWERYRALARPPKEAASSTRNYTVRAPSDVLRRAPETND